MQYPCIIRYLVFSFVHSPWFVDEKNCLVMKSQDIYLILKLVSLERQDAKRAYSNNVLVQTLWEDEDPEELQPELESDFYSLRALSSFTGISKSEVSNIIKRSEFSGLCLRDYHNNRPKVNKKALLEFLVYGIRYVFPVRPAEMVRGIPTAFFAPMLQSKLMSAGEDVWVWQDGYGKTKGLSIKPLHASVPKGAKIDTNLYELMALVDALRLGRAREVAIATELLKERFGL